MVERSKFEPNLAASSDGVRALNGPSDTVQHLIRNGALLTDLVPTRSRHKVAVRLQINAVPATYPKSDHRRIGLGPNDKVVFEIVATPVEHPVDSRVDVAVLNRLVTSHVRSPF